MRSATTIADQAPTGSLDGSSVGTSNVDAFTVLLPVEGAIGLAIVERMRGRVADTRPFVLASMDADGTDGAPRVDADLVIASVETPKLAGFYRDLRRRLNKPAILLQTARGLDPRGRRLSEQASEALGEMLDAYVLLSGCVSPEDLVATGPTSATLTSIDEHARDLVGETLVDGALHIRCASDLEIHEWAAGFGEALNFLFGLASGSELAHGTKAWLVASLTDEIVALAERELGLDTSFRSHDGPWSREVLAVGFADSQSRRFGELLGRGFSLADAQAECGTAGCEPDVSTVLRGLTARGVTQHCPGLDALTDLVVGARSLRELWTRLLNGA